jgi:hypothetical protein
MTMRGKSLNLFAALGMASLVLASPASALIISASTVTVEDTDATDGSTSFDVFFDGNVAESPVAGLTGEATLTLTEYNVGSITRLSFDVELTNTSSAPIDASRISVFGMDTEPDIADITEVSATGDFDQAVLNSSFPNTFGSIEVCFKSGQNNNCSGGTSGGAELGETIYFTINMGFSGPVEEVVLDNFGVRYQSIDSATLGLEDASGTGVFIPEPGAVALYGLGLLVSGLYVGKRLKS